MPSLGGAVIMAVLVARFGSDALGEARRVADVGSLVQGGAAGVVIVAVTTACGAWRWQLVARSLHVELSLTAAVTACYRSQFLNATLPGGVVGDLHRGVQHGRAVGDLGRGLRAVAWERGAGQVVLALVALPVLLLARPFTWPPLVVAAVALAVAAAVACLGCLGAAWAGRPGRPGRGPRLARVAEADARSLLDPAVFCGLVGASLVVVAGHVATFVVAARAVGISSPVLELLPLALVVFLASALPLNVAGWGPREGAAAWVFAASGLGASRGLATSVAFGAIVLVATLPGAVLLLAGRWRRSRTLPAEGSGSPAVPVAPPPRVRQDPAHA